MKEYIFYVFIFILRFIFKKLILLYENVLVNEYNNKR